jgi:hypothetical protein
MTWAEHAAAFGGGTKVACPAGMGAVLLLVLLPLIASLGFMFGIVHSDMSTGSMLAGIAFLLLCTFVFFCTFHMSRTWDLERHD